MYICSRDARLFLILAAERDERDEREVTTDEVEALVSAGFEVVQVDMREGAPLCATLAARPAGVALPNPGACLPSGSWARPEP